MPNVASGPHYRGEDSPWQKSAPDAVGRGAVVAAEAAVVAAIQRRRSIEQTPMATTASTTKLRGNTPMITSRSDEAASLASPKPAVLGPYTHTVALKGPNLGVSCGSTHLTAQPSDWYDNHDMKQSQPPTATAIDASAPCQQIARTTDAACNRTDVYVHSQQPKWQPGAVASTEHIQWGSQFPIPDACLVTSPKSHVEYPQFGARYHVGGSSEGDAAAAAAAGPFGPDMIKVVQEDVSENVMEGITNVNEAGSGSPGWSATYYGGNSAGDNDGSSKTADGHRYHELQRQKDVKDYNSSVNVNETETDDVSLSNREDSIQAADAAAAAQVISALPPTHIGTNPSPWHQSLRHQAQEDDQENEDEEETLGDMDGGGGGSGGGRTLGGPLVNNSRCTENQCTTRDVTLNPGGDGGGYLGVRSFRTIGEGQRSNTAPGRDGAGGGRGSVGIAANTVERYGALLCSSAGWQCTELFDLHETVVRSRLSDWHGHDEIQPLLTSSKLSICAGGGGGHGDGRLLSSFSALSSSSPGQRTVGSGVSQPTIPTHPVDVVHDKWRADQHASSLKSGGCVQQHAATDGPVHHQCSTQQSPIGAGPSWGSDFGGGGGGEGGSNGGGDGDGGGGGCTGGSSRDTITDTISGLGCGGWSATLDLLREQITPHPAFFPAPALYMAADVTGGGEATAVAAAGRPHHGSSPTDAGSLVERSCAGLSSNLMRPGLSRGGFSFGASVSPTEPSSPARPLNTSPSRSTPSASAPATGATSESATNTTLLCSPSATCRPMLPPPLYYTSRMAAAGGETSAPFSSLSNNTAVSLSSRKLEKHCAIALNDQDRPAADEATVAAALATSAAAALVTISRLSRTATATTTTTAAPHSVTVTTAATTTTPATATATTALSTVNGAPTPMSSPSSPASSGRCQRRCGNDYSKGEEEEEMVTAGCAAHPPSSYLLPIPSDCFLYEGADYIGDSNFNDGHQCYGSDDSDRSNAVGVGNSAGLQISRDGGDGENEICNNTSNFILPPLSPPQRRPLPPKTTHAVQGPQHPLHEVVLAGDGGSRTGGASGNGGSGGGYDSHATAAPTCENAAPSVSAVGRGGTGTAGSMAARTASPTATAAVSAWMRTLSSWPRDGSGSTYRSSYTGFRSTVEVMDGCSDVAGQLCTVMTTGVAADVVVNAPDKAECHEEQQPQGTTQLKGDGVSTTSKMHCTVVGETDVTYSNHGCGIINGNDNSGDTGGEVTFAIMGQLIPHQKDCDGQCGSQDDVIEIRNMTTAVRLNSPPEDHLSSARSHGSLCFPLSHFLMKQQQPPQPVAVVVAVAAAVFSTACVSHQPMAGSAAADGDRMIRSLPVASAARVAAPFGRSGPMGQWAVGSQSASWRGSREQTPRLAEHRRRSGAGVTSSTSSEVRMPARWLQPFRSLRNLIGSCTGASAWGNGATGVCATPSSSEHDRPNGHKRRTTRHASLELTATHRSFDPWVSGTGPSSPASPRWRRADREAVTAMVAAVEGIRSQQVSRTLKKSAGGGKDGSVGGGGGGDDGISVKGFMVRPLGSVPLQGHTKWPALTTTPATIPQLTLQHCQHEHHQQQIVHSGLVRREAPPSYHSVYDIAATAGWADADARRARLLHIAPLAAAVLSPS